MHFLKNNLILVDILLATQLGGSLTLNTLPLDRGPKRDACGSQPHGLNFKTGKSLSMLHVNNSLSALSELQE